MSTPTEKQSKIYYFKLFLGALEETFQFRRQFRYWLPVYAWGWLIFWLSSMSHVSILGLTGAADILVKKSGHGLEFFVLTLLMWRAFRSYGFSNKDSYAASAFISFFYAIFDEIHQLFVPLRHCSFWDFLIDVLGIAAFGLFFKLFLRREPKIKPHREPIE